MRIDIRFWIAVCAALVGGTFCTAAWFLWPGSIMTYGLLTASFAALLLVGVMQRASVGYLLLAVLLWIAFWLKLSVHLIDNTSIWVEPTGRFNFSATGWNEVALVSAVGAFAVLCVGLLWCRRGDSDIRTENTGCYTPRLRVLAWVALFLLTALVVVCNETFGVFHAGLRSQLELPWPLDGLFSWLVYVGLILCVMVLYYLDVISGRPLWLATVGSFIVSGALSITICSRGTFVLQGLPLLVTLVLLRKNIPWLTKSRLLGIVGMFICGMMLTVLASQQRRVDTIPAYQAPVVAGPDTRVSRIYSLLKSFSPLIRRLAVDRWVGLEGVMAVSAYPAKGYDLFVRAAEERRGKNHVDIYTGEISQSGFTDTLHYQFATLPGMFAFLYYSNSFLVLFVGVMLLAGMVIGVERVVCRTTHNPFLAGQVGMFAATLAIQMGAGGLVQPATVLVFTLVVAIMLGVFVRFLLSFGNSAKHGVLVENRDGII